MINRILFVLALSLSWVVVSAHETDEAYFEIRDDSLVLVIEAEFPWTLRKALLKAYPDSETSREVFSQNLFEYFQQNLKVESEEGPNPLQRVLQLEHEGHNHSVKYRLIFERPEFSSIKNTLMFNFSSHQKNVMIYEGSQFSCDPSNPFFKPGEENASLSRAWWLVILIIPGLVFIYKELS